MTIGAYPEVSLADARHKREDARKLLASNSDPGAVRKAQNQANTQKSETFETIAREWFKKFSQRWKETHSSRIIRSLERDVFPWVGTQPIAEIKAPALLAVLRRVEARGTLDTVHRIRTICGQIFRYAVASGRAERDPSGDLKGAIPPPQEGHMAACNRHSCRAVQHDIRLHKRSFL